MLRPRPLYLDAIYRWTPTPHGMDALGYGLIVSFISGLMGAFILPFGFKPTKWLSFVTCLLNAGFVLLFVVIESA